MTANPYAVAGGAVAVTATSTGQLTPPAPAGQGGYNFATVSNASPWFCTVVGAAGTNTLQPFTADIIPVSLGQLLSYTMSTPPGGSSTAISNQPTYIQVNWFAAGNAPPVGIYPVALPIPTINIDTIINPPPPPVTELLLATVPTGTSMVTVTLPNG